MQYALLIYEDESVYGDDDSPVMQDVIARHMSFGEQNGGAIRGGAGLRNTDVATTVRVRDGQQTLHDGPFAETKEQLGGFYLIEADDLDGAIAIARQIPLAGDGSIELRPLLPMPDAPPKAEPPLEAAFRAGAPRVIAALAARFRDLDLAEEAFAEACARAVDNWRADAVPDDPAAWLYRTAQRAALDAIRKRQVRARFAPAAASAPPDAEDVMADNAIPDERLRLIFVCCHPAVAADARAALTLRLVCGLSAAEIARAFLLPEPTLAQRLTRAKRKIADAGVPFEVPGPRAWPERLEAVLSTLEVAYSKAHEDAAGSGAYAGYAREMLELSGLLARLMPGEPEVHALAATIRYGEARRAARVDDEGVMIPLSGQDPALWNRFLIAAAEEHMRRARSAPPRPRIVQAAIHRAWCARGSLADPAPWAEVLALYDKLLTVRDDPVVRLNRLVALAEVEGPEAALEEFDQLPRERLQDFLPFHALAADLLRRSGRAREARGAYAAALALCTTPAEAMWLRRQAAASE